MPSTLVYKVIQGIVHGKMGFSGGAMVKKLPANAEDMSSTPGLGRSSGGRHGYPLQYSCLENPMDRGPDGLRVHGARKSWTRLKRQNIHVHMHVV